MDEEKTIAEQLVEDTDADTRDVIEDTDNGVADIEEEVEDNSAKIEDVLSAIDDLSARIDDAVDRLSALFVKGGGVVNDVDTIAEEIAEETYQTLEDLDYTL